MKSLTVNFLLFFIILISINSCSRSRNEVLYEVPVMDATLKAIPIFLSDYTAGSVEYIQLESKKECLLDDDIRLYSNDSIIIAISDYRILLFDRKTGSFLKEIGKQGRSPQEYRKNVYVHPYNEYSNTFISKGWEPNSFYEYNYEGELINKIVPPLNNSSVTSLFAANDTMYYGFIWNYDGKQDVKLIALNRDNEILKKMPQTQHFNFDINNHQIDVFDWDGWFYKYNNQVNVYEFLTDTIFSINVQENLNPRYVLKNRNLGAPYKVRFTPNFNANDYYYVNTLFESGNFLFISYRYQQDDFLGIYDKKIGQILASNEPAGFINDVDNLFPFRFYSLNSDNEIVGYQFAYEIINWYEQGPETNINLPTHLQLFKNLKESDNPIVVIAKLKE